MVFHQAQNYWIYKYSGKLNADILYIIGNVCNYHDLISLTVPYWLQQRKTVTCQYLANGKRVVFTLHVRFDVKCRCYKEQFSKFE